MKKTTKTILVILILFVLFAAATCMMYVKPDSNDTDDSGFSYGKGIDKNGYWKGIKALDYVELSDYQNIVVPKSEIDRSIDAFKAAYPVLVDKTSGVAEIGNVVNIDFVGYIDGEASDACSTDNKGYDVELGTGMMIPGFEDGILGHEIGEVFDVVAYFPDDETFDELRGKEAVFTTVINSMREFVDPEITDEFVAENLEDSYGWSTVDEMNASIKAQLAMDTLRKESVISNVPQSMIDYQMDMLLNYYQVYAMASGMDYSEFLSQNLGVADEAELRANFADSCKEDAEFSLFIQALAEDLKIVPKESDVKAYFEKHYGGDSDDPNQVTYDEYVERFGMPYVKNVVLTALVEDYFRENAVVE